MMYSNKLAVAIKSAQKEVLREFEDTVYIPFGEEYSIFVKNLNSVRASVNVSVDGEDVADGKSFVVDANDHIDIQRFIKNGNLSEGNRLKFIERTGSVERHRGIGVEDGLIRVEFKFERVIVPSWKLNNQHTYYGSIDDGLIGGNNSGNMRGLSRGVDIGTGGANTEQYTCDSFTTVKCSANVAPANEAGVTVAGSISDQQFNEISSFPLEVESHVIVLKLLGQTESNKVVEPVTVKAKPKCTTCGRVNKATAKFCANCGTSLTIV